VLGELPKTKPLAVPVLPLNQQNVKQQIPLSLSKGPNPTKPYFKGPIEYVKIPPDSDGPMYSKHNHDPALVDCPNGDLLAIWYSCRTERGRELGIVASRLRHGSEQWEPASVFWDAPDRNDHAPAMWYDGQKTIYHFNGLSAVGTWGNLALVMRTSVDSGTTWSKARLIAPEHGLRHQPVESVFRTREGFIILPCDAGPGGSGGTVIHISRNNGKTWTDPGQGQPAPKFEDGAAGHWIAGIHAGVVQLRDGSLLAFGRGNNIDGRMPMSLSNDMGRTWTYSASEAERTLRVCCFVTLPGKSAASTACLRLFRLMRARPGLSNACSPLEAPPENLTVGAIPVGLLWTKPTPNPEVISQPPKHRTGSSI